MREKQVILSSENSGICEIRCVESQHLENIMKKRLFLKVAALEGLSLQCRT